MTRFFINRPIVAMVISIIMVIVGVVSFLSLPVAQYPNIVPTEIAVNTTYGKEMGNTKRLRSTNSALHSRPAQANTDSFGSALRSQEFRSCRMRRRLSGP